MALGMLLSFFLALGWLSEPAQVDALRDTLRLAVAQPKRLTAALAAVDQMASETQHYDEDVRRRLPELQRLDADPRATRAAFEQLFGTFDADRVVVERRILDARFALRDNLTEEQWRSVFGR